MTRYAIGGGKETSSPANAMIMESKYKGVQNAHKMALLEAGLKFTPLSPTAKEMQFTESRKNTRDEILAIFRVPKPIIGILEDVNLASAEAADLLFTKSVIKPKMKFFVSMLNEFYLPLFHLPQTQYRFWFADPVPEDVEQKIRIVQALGKKGDNSITTNEARALFGWEPLTGGDELYTPPMETPINGSDKPDDEEHTRQDEEGEENAENAKSVKKNVSHKGHKLEKSEEAVQREQAYKQEQIAKLHTTYLDLNTDLQKRLLKRLKQYKAGKPEKTKEVVSYLTRLYKTFVKDTQDTQNDPFQNEMVRFIFANYDDWVGLIYNATEEGLTRIFEQSGKDTFADLNLEGSFSLQNPRALDWLSQHALEDSTSYSGTMKEDTALKVQEGVELGLSNEKIADSIKEFFTDQSDYRAIRIARTETINAYSAANLEWYKQSGIVSGKAWLPDAEACPICVDNAKAGVIETV